jgi:hypothetical protein
MADEVTWRVSPQVFSDLHTIIAKHGMDPHIDPELEMALRGEIRPRGPDAAALEIIEKYGLRKGIPLKIVVDYEMDGYDKPEYEGEENAKFNRSDSGTV